LLASATLTATERHDSVETTQLEEIANKFKGTALECKALINAFAAAKSADNSLRTLELGEKIIKTCPDTDQLPSIVATLGKISLAALLFEKGANFFEIASRKQDHKKDALPLLQAVANLRVRLGQRNKASQIVNTLIREHGLALAGDATIVRLIAATANLHLLAQDWTSIIHLTQNAVTNGFSSTEILYYLGYALYRQGNMSEANSFLMQALEQGRSSNSEEIREIAASSQFYLADIIYRAFETIQLSSDLSLLGETLQKKLRFGAKRYQIQRTEEERITLKPVNGNNQLLETFHLEGADAMAAGIPVVFCQGSGIDEVCGKKVSVGLTRSCGTDRWVKGIYDAVELAKKPEFSENLATHFKALPTWKDAALSLKKMYNELVGI